MTKLILLVSYFRKFKALQIFTIYLRYLIGIEKWQFLFRPYTHENLPPPQPLPHIGKAFWEILGLVLFLLIFALYALGYDVIIQMIACLLLGLMGFILDFLVSKRD